MPTERRHLTRLERLFACRPSVYFITTCTRNRLPILSGPPEAAILDSAFRNSRSAWAWRIGRYLVMPDHVHFFCTPDEGSDRNLSLLLQRLKSWTAHQLRALGHVAPIWQAEAFDHLLRGSESYLKKWAYVRNNPVRAGLVSDSDEWPWQGEVDEISM
jgi:REP element-mobilizing transposase RayT